MKDREGKNCFIITPIGNEGSDIFRRVKGVIDSVIKPVLEGYGFINIKAAYEINVSGMINTQIINRIIEDDLVVANLTGNNPNVMYELCLRHTVAKPIIHICEIGTALPFDIKDNRTIFYKNDMLGVKELKTSISEYLKEVDYDKEYMDNPIYTAYKYGKLLKETKGTETHEIIDLLLEISNQISRIPNPIFDQNSATYADRGILSSLFTTQHNEANNFISGVSNRLLEDFLKEKSNEHSWRVHELANKLSVDNEIIMHVAVISGIEISSHMSKLKSNDAKKIVLCLKQLKEFTDQVNEKHSE